MRDLHRPPQGRTASRSGCRKESRFLRGINDGQRVIAIGDVARADFAHGDVVVIAEGWQTRTFAIGLGASADVKVWRGLGAWRHI